MKSDTPGQVEIISTKLTVAKYKCICSIRKKETFSLIWFYVLHEGNACDCWFCVLKNFSRMRATKICQLLHASSNNINVDEGQL